MDKKYILVGCGGSNSEFNVSSDIEKEVDFSNGKYDEEDWDNWVEFVEGLVDSINW